MGYDDRYLISVVAPVYNESANIEAFYGRVTDVLQNTAYDYEIIFVNDGSKDDSMAMLTKLAYKNSKVKVIDLSRNFGKEIALSAGIDYASGDAVIPIDADLQDPPELIPKLIAKWQEGYDVVYATRTERAGETWLKKYTAHLFYRTINKLTKIEIPADTGDFRLLSKPVVEALKQMPERNRFMKGLFSWVGFRQTGVQYQRDSRNAGKSKYNYSKMWNHALDGITSFSRVPLQFAAYFGFIVAFTAFIYAIFIIVRTLFFVHDLPGYPSLITIILFLGGVQLMTIGILGEYIGRIYNEVKERPLYLIRAKYGFSDQTIAPMAKDQETADVFSSISHSFLE
ncbi:MAG TPA: glycosyltransferase family 2 protein [Syntrophaceticus sp.]|jgi:glycosyltransferase involved in cell wall biosynthesis|uniref:Bactoprenol glucosyl transferase CPS-53 (KpLE1) prophage n=1 Tax=Syntrophaceticus schinkii TaxID=499207 RepID=A0A0B7MC65_9FIRM|nr:glycosyltransferase family 2 protein [Syntrophaceticus schinkii]CEO87655.1 bactoprenol glucosyl transferase; CPS-53 (KpLE1) prophage [Syntrophaceticus schinkii]HHY31322.1 glycosyltransferase family 2 protein [Syntrophaceticus sp.]